MERNVVREDGGEDARLRRIAEALRLPWPFAALPYYRRIAHSVAAWQRERGASLVVGVCGSKGTGKSTLASFVGALLEADGLAVATLSLDDLVIASFTSGPGATTLPMKIYSQVRLGVTPEINAVCTILIAIVTIGVICASVITKRREIQRQRDEHAANAAA